MPDTGTKERENEKPAEPIDRRGKRMAVPIRKRQTEVKTVASGEARIGLKVDSMVEEEFVWRSTPYDQVFNRLLTVGRILQEAGVNWDHFRRRKQ